MSSHAFAQAQSFPYFIFLRKLNQAGDQTAEDLVCWKGMDYWFYSLFKPSNLVSIKSVPHLTCVRNIVCPEMSLYMFKYDLTV